MCECCPVSKIDKIYPHTMLDNYRNNIEITVYFRCLFLSGFSTIWTEWWTYSGISGL